MTRQILYSILLVPSDLTTFVYWKGTTQIRRHTIFSHLNVLERKNGGGIRNVVELVVVTMDSSLKIITLLDWWKGVSEEALRPTTPEIDSCLRLPLIDIREFQENKCLMTSNTVVVHLPFSTLKSGERSSELPPRNIKFAVLLDETQTNLEEAALFFGQTISQATQQSRKPWMLEQIILVNDGIWTSATKLGIMVDTSKENVSNLTFQPLSRLWQPDPMIHDLLWPQLNSDLMTLDLNGHPIEIWDLGSGAGRDISFLAEQIKATGLTNIKLVGVDNHKGSSDRCIPFWKHRNVFDMTSHCLLDLNKVPEVEEALGSSRIVCLYAVRFWNSKLVHWIASQANLKPTTLFAMSHFCKTGPTWDFDHPKEKRVLKRDELRNIFSKNWEILHDRIASDGDHGRTLVHFVARKL